MVDFRDRFKSIREKAGLTQKDFGERIGLSSSQINNIENGRSFCKYDTLVTLSTQFEVSLDWLLKGTANGFRDAKGREIIVNGEDEILLVPLLSQRVSAGPGQDLIPAQIVGKIPIPKRLIRDLNGGTVLSLEVRGDSMIGKQIFDGDIVFYQPGLIRDDGLYVITLGSDLLVKTLQWNRVKGTVAIHSENPRYTEPEVIDVNSGILRIEGKVVGWIHVNPY